MSTIVYQIIKKPCKTVHLSEVFDEKVSTPLYNYLKDNVQWIDEIHSQEGLIRKTFRVDFSSDLMKNKINQYIFDACMKIPIPTSNNYHYGIAEIYLTYYENGEMYTVNHQHYGDIFHIMILSLGTTRTLKIGKGEYRAKNGDVMIFTNGYSIYSVPKEPEVKGGRITIDVLMYISEKTNIKEEEIPKEKRNYTYLFEKTKMNLDF